MADSVWTGMSLTRLRAATSVVVGRNVTFALGRQNPSHDQLPDLILNTGHIPKATRGKIKTRLNFLRHWTVSSMQPLSSSYWRHNIMEQTKEFVAQKVREHLTGVHPGGITLEVLDNGIYQIDKW